MEKCRRGRPRSSRTDQNHYEFFKVYISQFCSDHLQIPRDFIKNFKGRQPNKLTVKNLTGQHWVLGMEMNKGGLFFKNGWPDFAKDNSLKDCEFLVFRYNELSGLTVRKFGLDGCKKEVYVKNETKNETEGDAQLAHNRNNLGKRIRRTKEEVTKESKRITATADEEDRALESANAFTSENPFFITQLKPTFLRAYLYIPQHIAMEHLNKKREDKFNITFIVSGRSWPICCSYVARSGTRIQRGWAPFASDNYLQAGDVCVFELIQGTNDSFNVTIFRARKSVDC